MKCIKQESISDTYQEEPIVLSVVSGLFNGVSKLFFLGSCFFLKYYPIPIN